MVFWGRVLLVLCCCCLLFTGSVRDSAAADRYKVLVVLSAEEDSAWDQEVSNQIRKDLASCCDLTFYSLNSCNIPEQNQQRAAEAFALYQKLRPDGVIAVDDAAQVLFVLPYLKDKVSTPVIFAGIYASANKYGYPATNVTGVQRRLFVAENLAFSGQLSQDIKTFAVLTEDTPCADLIFQQVMLSYPQAGLVTYLKVAHREDALQKVESIRGSVDLLLLFAVDGITDVSGHQVLLNDLIAEITHTFQGPTASPYKRVINAGALSGVLVSGVEIGQRAADMMFKVLRGTAIADLPVTRNYRGTRIINVKTLRLLGLDPESLVLRGAQLVTTP